MVTVVDTANLLGDYSSADFLADRGETAGEGDRRTIIDLHVEQIEFADVVVLNKVGLATPEQRHAARKIVTILNPDAKLVEADFGQVAVKDVLGTGRFDFDRAEQHPLWFKELHGFSEHIPETEEYGISSFVYRARRPFDPVRFKLFTETTWPGVVRAKGFFWLATRPDFVGELSQAGAQVRSGRIGYWWSAVPLERWPRDEGFHARMTSYFDPIWGDRRQEIVFIGAGDFNKAALKRLLDSCLLDSPAFTPDMWQGMEDPFESWEVRAA